MAQPKIQPSFNSGEWAPQLYARVDLEKYRSGAALLRNFFVDYRGGASTRPGTKYCLQAKDSANPVRLIPFQASFSVSYVLEFGERYIRFFYQGAPVLESALNITGATQANPCVVSVTNSYSIGDWVYISGVSGMTQLNGHYYKVSARTAGSITLTDLFGANINSSAFGAWTSGGTVRRVYTLTSPYDAADLATLKFAQNVSEMILCHPDYAPYSLTIVTATNWTLSAITFGATVGTPTGVAAATNLGAGSVNYSYIVTAVDSDGQESAPSSAVAVNSRQNLATTTESYIRITWTAVTGAVSYNIYKSQISYNNVVPAGVPYGFIGNVSGTTIDDTNIAADFTLSYPLVRNPFTSNNPSVPVFFQQRLVLAAPTAAPQTLYFSQPGAYTNFNATFPTIDSDAIVAELASGQLNNIKSMVPQSGGLIVFSDGASWLINGGSQGAAVTPSAIVANAQAFDGANDMPPIVANYDVLFVSSKGSSVRDSTYNFYANVFTGVDISVLSSHLFFGYTLTEWSWAQEPYKVVWAVRNDGTMLTLTFIKDQEFIGWAHSDTTGGTFESVCSIVEAVDSLYVNAVYTVVERTVNSQTVKYIERFAERDWETTTECWCVDAGLSYSGSPATNFTGGEHLSGLTVTGLADGVEITPFVMPYNGAFTLATAASEVVVGIGFTAQLKTLPLDVPNSGEPTVQGKPKKINAVTVRVAETLGLKIGSSFTHLVTMKDLVLGNVSSMLIGQDTQTVSDLYSGDVRTYLDPTYTVPGQYCIQQDKPYPATILGVIPQFDVGDSRK